MDRNSAIIRQIDPTHFTVVRASGKVSGFTTAEAAAKFCETLDLIWSVDSEE